MRNAILYMSVLVAAIGFAGNGDALAGRNAQPGREASNALAGTRSLQVANLRHEAVATLVIRFADEQAESCIGGDWKRVVVESHSASDAEFFPAAEPLSYELKGDALVIGRNEICDAYLHLTGVLRDSNASGEYVAFGFSESRLVGYFSLGRSSR